jgi:hypothetical protein
MYILVHTGTYMYVLVCNVPVCTSMYCVVLDKMCDVQAHTIQSAGTVRLDINLLKPLRLEFPAQPLATQLSLPVVHRGSSPPDWLEYVYRTSHPVHITI